MGNASFKKFELVPSLFFMDQISSQLRIVRPVAWNKTEVISQCIGVKGESAEARRNRIRQFEDFFNVSGGTPDDLVEFREQQKVFRHDLNVGRYFTWLSVLGIWRDQNSDLGIQPVITGREFTMKDSM